MFKVGDRVREHFTEYKLEGVITKLRNDVWVEVLLEGYNPEHWNLFRATELTLITE